MRPRPYTIPIPTRNSNPLPATPTPPPTRSPSPNCPLSPYTGPHQAGRAFAAKDALERGEVDQLRPYEPEPDGLTRPAPLAAGEPQYKLTQEGEATEHWQPIFAALREECEHFQAKIRRLARRSGIDDHALEQLAWDKREEWVAARYETPSAGRRFHDRLDVIAGVGDLVFDEERP